jgi:hypothetical protein
MNIRENIKDFFKQAFIHFIRGFGGKETLKKMIERDQDIVDLIKEFQFVYDFAIKKIAKDPGVLEDFTYDRVMNWLKENLPDVYELFDNNEKAKKWLKRNIEKLKKLIYEDIG